MTINNAEMIYAQSIEQCVDAIATLGSQITYIIEGDIGCGKSTIGRILAKRLPEHHYCYFDCTTKDVGDLFIPNVQEAQNGSPFVSFVPNEELGVHLGQPVIINFDEFGKATHPVKLASLRIMLEREVGTRTLPQGSIVFGTTNLGEENLGDLLEGHARNRVVIIRMRKPSHTEWMEWGINNGIDHTLIAWVKDSPRLFQSFTEVENPDDNEYIYHPKAERSAFVTPRSLHTASKIVSARDILPKKTIRASLIGAIGVTATADLMAFVDLADQMPTMEEIKTDPTGAVVPTSAPAVMMILYRTLTQIDAAFVSPWMTYLQRLDVNVQSLFANQVIKNDKYDREKRKIVANNADFTKWARANQHLYMTDAV